MSILALANTAVAQDTRPAHPMFKVQPGLRPNIHKPTALPAWTFKWTYSGTKYSAVFVGTTPSGGASTTVPVEIIPVIMSVGSTVENPNGQSTAPTARTIASPIFDSTTNYTQGGTNLGTTQYEDAFQRGALWGDGVSSHTGYHVLLGAPKQLSPLRITGDSVATEFGVTVILKDINAFDSAIQATVGKQPVDSLPIFITSNTYLTSGGSCCIGGYHSYTGTQAYAMFTYIKKAGVFAQDVSALSHEVGEWMDDPETANTNTPCGIYEVGDPLEGGEPGHPYGDWAYPLNGFTYHLQDLVFPPYFGAPYTTSVNRWSTFQGYGIGVCANGG